MARTTTIILGSSAVVPPSPSGPSLRLLTWDAARGQDGVETALATAISWSSPPKLNMGSRGYSGSSHPATFAASSVSNAASWNNFAMLNTKPGNGDWAGMANGAYDSLIDGFWDSWPKTVRGKVTAFHEPENDGRTAEAADWIAGLVHYISRSAARIRLRDLDCAVGGVLMGFSFENGSGPRYPTWRWWNQVPAVDLPQTFFGIDKYATTDPGPVGENIISGSSGDLTEIINLVRAESGITRFSVFETALDKRQSGTLNDPTPTIIGTDTTIANWIPGFYTGLQGLVSLGLEDVCYFHSPTGAASQYAQLNGPALTAWANAIADAHGS